MAIHTLKEVADKIRILQNTSATNDKVELLKTFLKDDIFRRCFVAAYSETADFRINKLPERRQESVWSEVQSSAEYFGLKYSSIDDVPKDLVLRVLKKISRQRGVSKSDKFHLSRIANIDSDTYAVTEMICKKDMYCKVSASTLNKAVPGTVFVTPYQRCSPMSAFGNIVFNPEAIIQNKANGLFAYCIIQNVNGTPKITFKSRRGHTIHQLEHLKSKLCTKTKDMQFGKEHWIFADSQEEIVLMGELRVFEHDGTIMPRTKGNGIISSCISGTADAEYLDSIFYTVWDCIPLVDFRCAKTKIPYRTRFYTTTTYVHAVDNPRVLQTIPFKYVKNRKEANEFYKEMIQQGEEGAIIKNLSVLWQNNTSTDMVKMKPIMEVEMKIMYVVPHTKKEGWMGALVLQSADGEVNVNCGSGFTDADRQLNWKKSIGKIVSIETEGLIQDKRTKAYSLYLPVFVELRADKTEANTLKEIQNMDIRPEGREKHITTAQEGL